MDAAQISILAHEVAPYLNWIGSHDGQGGMGTSLPFAGATVATSMGPATINLTNVGGAWVGEVVLRKGTTAQGGEHTLLMQAANLPTIKQAFESLLEIAQGASTLLQGLKEAEGRYQKSDEGRLNALGLVGANGRAILGDS